MEKWILDFGHDRIVTRRNHCHAWRWVHRDAEAVERIVLDPGCGGLEKGHTSSMGGFVVASQAANHGLVLLSVDTGLLSLRQHIEQAIGPRRLGRDAMNVAHVPCTINPATLEGTYRASILLLRLEPLSFV